MANSQIMQRLESDTTLDNACASGRNQYLWVVQARQALAVFRQARREFGGHYSNVGNR